MTGKIQAGDWSRPHTFEDGEVQVVIIAVLKAYGGQAASNDVRHAALLCLEPSMLVPMLSPADRQLWECAIGSDARARVSLEPLATLYHWGSAVSGLRGRGRIVEDGLLWRLGDGFETIDTRGWLDGRARFVVARLRDLLARFADECPLT